MACAVVAMLPGVVDASFVWDDAQLVALNTQTASWDPVAWLGADLWQGTPQADSLRGYYRPWMVWSLFVDRAVFGLAPGWHRLHSVLLHAGAAGALYALARRLDLSPASALLGGLLFALHPAQVESVLFVAARNDVLAAAATLGSLALLARDDPKPGHLVGAGALALVALLSKETAVLAVFMLAAVHWTRARSLGPRVTYVPWAVALAVYGGLRAWAGVGLPPGAHGLGPVLAVSAEGWSRSLLWPLQLAPGLHAEWSDLGVRALPLVGIGVIWLALRAGRRGAAGLVIAGLGLAPALVAVASVGLVADRYLYLPLAGLGLALAGALEPLGKRRWYALAGLVPLLPLTLLSTPSWSTDVGLWQAAVVKHPNPYTYGGLAAAYDANDQWDQAAPYYALATQGPRPFEHACFNAARIHIKRGDLAQAASEGVRALDAGCAPSAELLAPTALALAFQGEWDQAEALARQVDQDPTGKAVIVRSAAALRRGDTAAIELEAERLGGDPADLERAAVDFLRRAGAPY